MSKKKKITFFMQDFSGGGAEKMFINILNALYDKGYNVNLVVIRDNGPYKIQLNKNIKIHNLKSKKTAFSIFKLIKYLWDFKPDVIISTLVHINILSIVCAKLIKSNATVIIRESNNLSKQRNVQLPFIRFAVYLAPYIYPLSDKCVAISKGVKKELVDYGKMNPNKISVVYNPAVTNYFLREIETVNKPEEWINIENRSIIISAGRFEEQKDFKTLIRAFEIIQKNTDAILVIFGQGSQKENIEKLVKKLGLESLVKFPGFVKDLPRYMKHSDLFILSSKWEGFGNVLVEALACQLQIVSTDCPYGPSEILQNGKYGSLVPVGDHDKMAMESISILKKKKRYIGLRKRALEFHVDRIAEEYLNVIFSKFKHK